MDEWIIYGDSSDPARAYLVRQERPRFVLELEVGEDGTWRACEIWALDTVTAGDVEALMRDVSDY